MRFLHTLLLGVTILAWWPAFSHGKDPGSREPAAKAEMAPSDGDAPAGDNPDAGSQPTLPPPGIPPGEGNGLWHEVLARSQAYTGKFGPPWAIAPDFPIHLLGGGGIYLVKPHLESNPAFTVFRTQGVGRATTLQSSGTLDLGYDAEFTPRVFLGIANDSGLGLRTTWWHFDEGSHRLGTFNGDTTLTTLIRPAPVFGVPGFTSPGGIARVFSVFNDALTFQTHLNTHVWDWEVTQEWHPAGWDLVLGGGVRYTYLSQNYLAFRFNSGRGRLGTSTVNLTQDEDLIQTGHNFSGVGPFGTFEAHRRLGDTGFAVYGIGRGAVVFGRGRTQSFQATLLNGQIIPRTGRTTTFSSTTFTQPAYGHNDVLPITEVEIGVEWSHHWGRPLLFVQAGLVSQEWFNAGSGTSDNGDLSFFGLSLSAGVTF